MHCQTRLVHSTKYRVHWKYGGCRKLFGAYIFFSESKFSQQLAMMREEAFFVQCFKAVTKCKQTLKLYRVKSGTGINARILLFSKTFCSLLVSQLFT